MLRKLILAGGSVLLLYGCSDAVAPAAPATTGPGLHARQLNDGDPCTDANGRTGYFVRAGNRCVT